MSLLFARGPQVGFRLFLCVILSILLMVLDHRQHYLISMRNLLTALVAPVQYAVNRPIKLSQSISINLTTRKKLLAENAALRAEIFLLKAQLQKMLALENENNQLRTLLTSSTQMRKQHSVIAQLLSVDTDPLVSEVILDKGKHDGIYVGQPVFDAYGIMGQVVQVGPLTSRVLLITDLRSAVPIQNARNGLRGLAVGRGKLANLVLMDVSSAADIRPGDVLVTSGLGGRYPAGYPVGEVKSVQRKANGQFMEIEVVPKAQLNRSQQVLLIWPKNSAS